MTPSAPIASMGSVRVSLPERTVKSVRQRISLAWSTEPLASLMATMFSTWASRSTVWGSRWRARAGRHVVEHQRQRAGLGDPGEVGVKTVLRGPVVIGGDDQRPVGAGLRGEAGQPDGLGGRARAGTGQDSCPARGLFDHGGDHPLVLDARQGRRLSRRAGRAQDCGALVNLPVHHPPQVARIDLPVAHRRHQRDGASREHLTLR